MGLWRQIAFLLRKNLKIKLRNKKQTLQEVIIPAYWLLILLAVKLGVPSSQKPAIKTSEIPRFDLLGLDVFGKAGPKSSTVKPIIGYVANNEPRTLNIVKILEQSMNYTIEYREFNTSEEMITFYKSYGLKLKFYGGIVFDLDKQHDGIAYTLRVPGDDIPSVKTKLTNLGKCHNVKAFLNPYDCPANEYITHKRVILMQASIDAAISMVIGNLSHYVLPNVTVQMMPKEVFTPSQGTFNIIVPIYMILGFAPFITILVISLVTEKSEKHKELMRIMGMLDTAYWLSWFLTYAIVIFIACLIMTAISVPAGFFGPSNFAVILIILYLYGLSLITLSFLISPLFKNPKTAGFMATLFTLVFGVLVIPLAKPTTPKYAKWLISLLSPTALAFALNEGVGIDEGLQFSNLATKGHFPVLNSIIMLIVDIFLYLFLALYLDRVVPAEYGERQPWYFIFQPSYWKGLCCYRSMGDDQQGVRRQLSEREVHNSDEVEPVAQEMIGREAIRIHKLKKVFHGKEETVAVDGISMDIYEGQVTALLGHNGAGKSTLIAAMTGMTPPTSGTAIIYGMDITKSSDLAAMQKNIGVCPQQDVIFEFLTVKEHLQFYSGLKDVPSEDIEPGVDAIIKEIGMEDKRDDIAKNLSGGQKRKLCVGIALCGNPKVLFLDEPTSGMDPYSRRTMWRIIQQRAKDRCVLLTTHFMDEADILADYKAIMSKGKLRCAGTSLFLKSRFGIGYHLNTALSADCDDGRLTQFVKEHVTGADVIRHHGYEMAFSLPLEEVATFSGLFAALEANNGGEIGCAAKDLGVTSYGVSMTTLEEVFLQLEDTNEESTENGQETSAAHGQTHQTAQLLAVDDGNVVMSGSQASGLNNGNVELNVPEMAGDSTHNGTWYNQQAAGLLKIRWLNTIRSPLKVIFQIIIPPIVLVIGLVLFATKTVSTPEDTVQLPLAPSYCLTPASTESYAASLLYENSTGRPMENVMGFLSDYKVGVDLVQNLEGYLNSSSAKPRCLGIDFQKFPTVTNLSAATMADLSSKVLMRYNDTTVHSIPVGLNLLGSLYNMYILATQNRDPWPIKTFLQPLPDLKPKWTYDSSAFVSVLLVGMAFSLIPGGFGIECVSYRQMGGRHILRVSGLHDLMYWFHFFAADFIVFFIPAILMLILIPAIGIPALSPSGAMGSLVIAVLLYIPSNILFSYCMSFMFSSWESSQQVLPNIINMLGVIPYVTVAMVDLLASPDTAIIMHYAFTFCIPCYGVFGAVYYISRIHLFAAVLAQSNDVSVNASEYFTWTKYNGIPAVFISLTLHTILLSLLLYYLDSRNTGAVMTNPCTKLSCLKSKRKIDLGRRMTSFQSEEPEDDDVREEKERLLRTEFGQYGQPGEGNGLVTAVKGLWKKFGRGKKGNVVVKDVYFGVQQGEVFGLLGPNGAGKTTTLNMMTANFPPSRGSASIAGYDIRTHARDVFQHLGFCPQTDALFPDITLEEHLTLFARVRGVPWDKVSSVVNHYMQAMKIVEHAKKRSKDLSGGTKRKLSFGMAMLGDPDLLLLDEPSTGMDPSARRFLWNTISRNVTGSRGAILTTHSMEEADALCSRVGIMVKGQLKCIGSTQHLKSKFGSGYSLEIKLSHDTHNAAQAGDDVQARLIEFVEKLFPGATRTESFGDRVMYKVPKDNVSQLSNTFAALEEGKRTIGIEEYSFSQSTLEQVFLEFAREQDDDRTGAQDSDKIARPSSASSYANNGAAVPPV